MAQLETIKRSQKRIRQEARAFRQLRDHAAISHDHELLELLQTAFDNAELPTR